MKIAIILAFAAFTVNIFFIWFSKKSNKVKLDESYNPNSGPPAFLKENLTNSEVKQLKESAAAELDLSVDELDHMLAWELKQLSKEQELMNIE